MVTPGSIAVPGAVIMVNNDLSPVIQNRLEIQLHINESMTGSEFDLRLAANPNYARENRILRRRLLVIRDHRDTTNREEMDIVMFIKHAMASVTKNCFGPPGQTYLVRNLYWGAICIYHTVPDRTCNKRKSCDCNTSYFCSDGYGKSPYYPAICDPMYPQENHWYNQWRGGGCNGCGKSCNPQPTFELCRQYDCRAGARCQPQLDCRLVKAVR
jgi:hypothetical protein